MTNFVSPAQELPSNILRQIIHYGSNSRGEIANNLLYVCLNWRSAALEYMWKKFVLTIGKDDTILLFHPRKINRPNFTSKVAGYVRILDISVSMASIVSGMASKLLRKYLGDITILPAANKLSIQMTGCYRDHKYPKDISYNNVLEFAQLIQSLTPAEPKVEVTYNSTTRNPSTRDQMCFGKLLALLANRSKHIHLSLEIANYTRLSAIDSIPQVSSLDILCEKSLDSHANLVHRCANSLLNLYIRICDAKTLFYDTNGSIVVYPHLQSLMLSEATYKGAIGRASVPDVVPLPLLRELIIYCPYPYDDDVLFRGSSATLERLHITIDWTIVNILNSNGVFRNQNLNLTIFENHQSGALLHVSDTNLSKFIGSLVGAAQKLNLSFELSVDRLVAAVPSIHGFQYLNHLSISNRDISLFDVLRLQKAIPSLSSIYCGIDGLGLELEHIAADELPEHIVSTYGNAGNSLQVWTMAGYNSSHNNLYVECILLLALACPKFHRVKHWPCAMEDYYERIAEAIGREPYIKYASQLKWRLGGAY